MIRWQNITGRMAVTLLLVGLFLPVMSFHHIPKLLHEVIGLAWLAVAMVHLWQNRRWFVSLRQGKWDGIRVINTMINVVLILCLLAVVVAGSGISHHLFKEIMPMDIRRSITLHQLHLSLPYAMLILMGLHWGLHFDGWLKQWKKVLDIDIPAKVGRIIVVFFGIIVIAGGIYGSFLNRVGDRLLMKHIFATEAAGAPMLVYVLLLLAIMGIYIAIGWLLKRKGRVKQ